MTTRQLQPMGEGWPLEDSSARGALVTWLDLLATWNARMDLTAARSPEELVDLMTADARVLAARIPEGASVVDVGAGAGAPGLAVGLMRPDVRMRLVEPLTKRVAFLRTVIGTLGARASHITVERARGEDVAQRGDQLDVAIARATLAPPAWLALGARLVRDGGSVWVLLAKDAAPEAPRAAIADDLAYDWPLTHAARRAVRYVVRG